MVEYTTAEVIEALENDIDNVEAYESENANEARRVNGNLHVEIPAEETDTLAELLLG